MRTLPTGQSNILDTGSYGVRLRVFVEDGGGTLRDLTTYAGQNFLLGASWSENVDDAHMVADITLKREIHAWSLGVLVEDSPLNTALGVSSYDPLLMVGRRVTIETALVPVDHQGSPTGWMLAFDGFIDVVDWGAGENVVLYCRDKGAALADHYIEEELVYAYEGTTAIGGLRVFEENYPYTAGQLVVPSNGKLTGYYYQADGTGSSGSEPDPWPTTGTVTTGAVDFTTTGTTTDTGKPLEEVLQNILDDNLGVSAPVLAVDASPGWDIKQFIQQREPLLDALRALTLQIGWECRYRWVEGAGEFQLVLYEPDRGKTTPDRTFSGADYLYVEQLRLDIASIRNAIRIWYEDTADRLPSGQAKIKSVSVTDSASITQFGRRFMEIAEEATKNIDTSTEATAMANACLSDLAWPEAEMSVGHLFLPIVELGDLYRYSANRRHFDADLDLAVIGYEHSVQAGSAPKTTLRLRGRPAGAFKRWLTRASWPGVGKTHQKLNFPAAGPATVDVTPIIGGVRAKLSQEPIADGTHDGFEVHVGGSSSFTADATTLVAYTRGSEVVVNDLKPGDPYWLRYVPIGRNAGKPIAGLPSESVAFTAGRAKAGALESEVRYGMVPLNGGFETRFDSNSPPDHWTLDAGALGTNATVVEGGTSKGGRVYMKLNAASGAAPQLNSSLFTVNSAADYVLRFWAKNVTSTSEQWQVSVRWYTSTGVFLSSSSVVVTNNTSVGSWVEHSEILLSNANGRLASVRIEPVSWGGTSMEWHVDSVVLEEHVQVPQGAWSTPTLLNSWVNYDATNFAEAAYIKDTNGFVHLKGLIKDGTATTGTVLFTLPSGYRPGNRECFVALSATTPGTTWVNTRIDIYANGNVVIVNGGNVFLSLAGITFRAEG